MQFQLNENRINFLLCILGIVFGLNIGYFIKDGAESFRSIGHNPHFENEIFNNQIASLISFGIAAGIAVQVVSVLLIWIVMAWNIKQYDFTPWWLIGIPFGLIGIPIGMLVIFDVFSDRLVSFGFIATYILHLTIPSLSMIVVGFPLLYINALYLLFFYVVSTVIVWLLESFMSIV